MPLWRPARWVDPVGDQMSVVFDPPDAVVGNLELPLRVKIEAREDDRSHGQKEQKNRNRTDLAFPIHGFRWRLPDVAGGPQRSVRQINA